MSGLRDRGRARDQARRALASDEVRAWHARTDTDARRAGRRRAIASSGDGRRRRVRWLPAVAVGLAAAALVALGLVLDRAGEDATHASVSRLLAARAAGAPGAAADRERLEAWIASPRVRAALLRDPLERGTWEALAERLPDGLRAGGAGIELVAPRGTLTDARPTFAFEAAAEPGAGFAVAVASAGGWRREYRLAVGDATATRHELRVPEGEALEAGRDYAWTVRREPGDPDAEPPAPLRFRVEPPALVAELTALGGSGDAGLDALARAAALNAHGFAREALDELRALDRGAWGAERAAERRLADLLEAEALALAGDATGFARVRARADATGFARVRARADATGFARVRARAGTE